MSKSNRTILIAATAAAIAAVAALALLSRRDSARRETAATVTITPAPTPTCAVWPDGISRRPVVRWGSAGYILDYQYCHDKRNNQTK